MSERARLWLLVVLSYALARAGGVIFFTGAWPHLNAPLLAELAFVPAVEIAALELVRRLWWRRAW